MTATSTPAARPPVASGGRGSRLSGSPVAVALLTWLVAGALAAAVPPLLDPDPFAGAGRLLPAAVGAVAVVLVTVPALWRGRPWMCGLAVGLFAAFTVLVLRAALHGTPYAYEGVLGDTGRLTAMANRYTTEWAAVDGTGTGVRTEYPPLFPWLIGKVSALSGVPAWRLLAPAEILTVSGSVVAGFALWLRLVRAPAAAALAVVSLLAIGTPNTLGAANKAYEVIALAVTVPWLLLVAGAPPRGRPHWLPAGLVGGFLLLDYYAYVVFCAAGLPALVWLVARSERDAGRYLLYLVRVVAVALACGSLYLAPYLWNSLVHGAEQVNDTYQPVYALQAVIPFLQPTLLGAAELAGLVGLLVHRRAWWAMPMWAILGGCYVYVGVNVVRNHLSGHTGLFYYAGFVINAVLLAALVLAVTEAAPRLVRRYGPAPRSRLVAGALAGCLTACGGLYFVSNQPSISPGGFLAYAHMQPLPDGSRPRFAARAARAFEPDAHYADRLGFPLAEVLRGVDGALGRNARPRILASDEMVFAFRPWRGYLSMDRGPRAARCNCGTCGWPSCGASPPRATSRTGRPGPGSGRSTCSCCAGRARRSSGAPSRATRSGSNGGCSTRRASPSRRCRTATSW
ncbi:arabinofuranosyltransferase [Actinomadura kijaniata]|uniref:arabinofuranosyltransferase n=1 Tax=Actinomadura kijaniata TaxID=46161 RepID=UPI00082D4DAE|nr:arabinofuranosyltransferase [Actinomadura kijaniata]